MDVERCHEFVVLAQTRNYLEASEQLFISQSSLSKHIKSLEKELGVTLLNRSTRRVELSAAGRIFLPYARRMAQIDYELVNALTIQENDSLHVLSIGTIPVMAPYGITAVLSHFERANKNSRLQLVEGDADKLRDLLRKGRIELAFIRESHADASQATRDDELSTVPYADDRLVAVLPKDHPLAARKRIRLGELADEDFLLLPKGSVMCSLIFDACASEGFTPSVRYHGSRAENIIDLVSRGMGVSLLMGKPAAYLASPGVRLVEVEPAITSSIKLCFLSGHALSDDARRFIDCVPIYLTEELS